MGAVSEGEDRMVGPPVDAREGADRYRCGVRDAWVVVVCIPRRLGWQTQTGESPIMGGG
jgi:hypothetical protein